MTEALCDIVVALAVVPATQTIEHGVNHGVGEDKFDCKVFYDGRGMYVCQAQYYQHLLEEIVRKCIKDVFTVGELA